MSKIFKSSLLLSLIFLPVVANASRKNLSSDRTDRDVLRCCATRTEREIEEYKESWRILKMRQGELSKLARMLTPKEKKAFATFLESNSHLLNIRGNETAVQKAKANLCNLKVNRTFVAKLLGTVDAGYNHHLFQMNVQKMVMGGYKFKPNEQKATPAIQYSASHKTAEQATHQASSWYPGGPMWVAGGFRHNDWQDGLFLGNVPHSSTEEIGF